jgi:ribosome-binding protein aMBF1 (putative translation factor)
MPNDAALKASGTLGSAKADPEQPRTRRKPQKAAARLTDAWRKPIAERLSAPTPQEVRSARERVGLTQGEAAQLITASAVRPFRTWQNYEIDAGQKGARTIPLPVWELFLLMTDQHPDMRLTVRRAT